LDVEVVCGREWFQGARLSGLVENQDVGLFRLRSLARVLVDVGLVILLVRDVQVGPARALRRDLRRSGTGGEPRLVVDCLKSEFVS
jgi:hypothetical protein